MLVLRPEGSAPREIEIGQAGVVIGRATECDIVLDSMYVSRRHARIAKGGEGGFELLPLADRNPVLVNRERVFGHRLLVDGDVVHVADVAIEFREGPEEGATEIMPVSSFDRLQDRTPVLSAAERVSTQTHEVIMAAELRNARALVDTLGDRRAAKVLRAHRAILAEALELHGSEELRAMEDGTIAGFGAVPAAVGCAVAIIEQLGVYNHEHPSLPLEVSVGIDGPDRRAGRGANLLTGALLGAARLADRARASEILVSVVVREGAGAVPEWMFQPLCDDPDSEAHETAFRIVPSRTAPR